MTILITGAGGFIGNALIQKFQQRLTPVRVITRVASAQKLSHGDTIDVREIDSIDARTRWETCLEGVKAIVHLAARAHIMRDRASDPLAAFRSVNAYGTLNLAHQAAAAGVRRFVYISSIKVNGESTHGVPFRETDAPNPQDAYAISKWEAEEGLNRLAQVCQMEIVILRPPLVYGPGVKGNFLSLLRLLDLGLPLPFKQCDNRRSLVALDNLVDLVLRCIEHPAAVGQTFCVADGEDLSTPDLLERLGRAMYRPARLWKFPSSGLRLALEMLGKSTIYERLCGSLQIDAGKARRMLEWTPPVDIEEGLGQVASWYRARLPK